MDDNIRTELCVKTLEDACGGYPEMRSARIDKWRERFCGIKNYFNDLYARDTRVYCGDMINLKTFSKSNKLKKEIKNSPGNIRIPTRQSSIVKLLTLFRSTLREEIAPINRAKSTNIRVFCTMGNVVQGFIRIAEKTLTPRRTILCAAVAKAEWQNAHRITSGNRFLKR